MHNCLLRYTQLCESINTSKYWLNNHSVTDSIHGCDGRTISISFWWHRLTHIRGQILKYLRTDTLQVMLLPFDILLSAPPPSNSPIPIKAHSTMKRPLVKLGTSQTVSDEVLAESLGEGAPSSNTTLSPPEWCCIIQVVMLPWVCWFAKWMSKVIR